MSDLRRGYRYQVSTYNLAGVWFVLDTYSPRETIQEWGDETARYYGLPIVATALSRAAARNIARIKNHEQPRVA